MVTIPAWVRRAQPEVRPQALRRPQDPQATVVLRRPEPGGPCHLRRGGRRLPRVRSQADSRGSLQRLPVLHQMPVLVLLFKGHVGSRAAVPHATAETRVRDRGGRAFRQGHFLLLRIRHQIWKQNG